MTSIDIPFSFGQNNKLPALTGREFFAVEVQNLLPEAGHFTALHKLEEIYSAGEIINKFAYTFDPASRVSDLYGFSPSGVYSLGRNKSKIYTATSSTNQFAAVQWQNVVYFTRADVPLRKAQGGVTSAVTTTTQGTSLGAKYAIAAHDKLFLGNVTENGVLKSTTVRWSDLYNPENFNISELTEADSFQLSVDDLEITGLALHRNQVLIFSYNSIWTANYEGLPGVYSFSPLYGGVGCSYHYSVIRVKDIVYFISTAGVYKMDSFQLVDIGSDIWPSLSKALVGLEAANASVDEQKKLIFWTAGNKTFVYNYEEGRWTTINSSYCGSIVSLPGSLKSTAVIDDITVSFDSLPNLAIDEGYQTQGLAIAQQLLSQGTKVYAIGTTAAKVIPHDVRIELPYAYFESLWTVKEFTKFRIEHAASGQVDMKLEVKSKPSFNSTNTTNDFFLDYSLKEFVFYARNLSLGKLTSFTLTYSNTETLYIDKMLGISLGVSNASAER